MPQGKVEKWNSSNEKLLLCKRFCEEYEKIRRRREEKVEDMYLAKD
jgi:hypothetical protein